MKINKIFTREGNTIQALWVGMGSLSSFALAIVSAAILSRYFNKTDYGTYRQILYVYNTLLVIFTAGLPRVFSYFLPRYSIEQGKDIVLKISKMLFVFGLIFSLFLFSFSGIISKLLNNPELSSGLKYFSLIPMFLLPTLGIEGIFSTYKKTIYIAIYNTLSRLLMLLFIVLPVIVFNGTLNHALLGWIIVSFLSFWIAIYFKRIPFKQTESEKTTLSWKEIFSYSLPLVGATIAGIALRSADQFYISRYYGTEVFADYVNGFIEIPFVAMITGTTAMILMPQFSKMIHDKTSVHNITNLWRNALTKSALLIYPMVVFFIFNAKYIIVLLYSAKYSNSYIYFQIAMIVNFFNIIIFAPLLFSMGETRFYMKTQILFAILAWIGGFVIVSTTKSPQIIALYSVSLSIFLVIVFLKKVSSVLDVSISELIPFKKFFSILIHSFIIITTVLLIGNYLLNFKNEHLKFISNFCIYVVLILLTSSWFNNDYLIVIKSLLIKKHND